MSQNELNKLKLKLAIFFFASILGLVLAFDALHEQKEFWFLFNLFFSYLNFKHFSDCNLKVKEIENGKS